MTMGAVKESRISSQKSTYSSLQQPCWIGTIVILTFRIRKWGMGGRDRVGGGRFSDLPKITEWVGGCFWTISNAVWARVYVFLPFSKAGTAFLWDTKRWELARNYVGSDSMGKLLYLWGEELVYNFSSFLQKQFLQQLNLYHK